MRQAGRLSEPPDANYLLLRFFHPLITALFVLRSYLTKKCCCCQ
nr:MAG TPA: hypothetical protein [Caudoviricetes sp.]